MSKLERGLVVAIDHSRITSSNTNNSPSKAAWSMSKGNRFEWQINPIHKRISYTNSYSNSSFLKKKATAESTFGSTIREAFPPKRNPSPAEYIIPGTFKRSVS